MFKKIFTMFSLMLVLSITSNAQWEYEGVWPDTNYKGGTHGIEITPDGNIWTASYFNKTTWITPNGDTLNNVSPILVFSADGSSVDTIFTVTTGSVIDTLGLGGSTSGTRGITKDQNGNIIFVSSAPSKMIKINYQTYEGMARYNFTTELGTSPTAPSVSDDGTIFVGPVVGNGGADKAIAMFDTDLNYLGNAVQGPPAIARTMEVSADGNSIYWTPFTGLMMYIYTRTDEFSDFALTDSLLEGMSIESTAWNPATGLLWVSNDSRGSAYTHLTWYGVDVTTKAIVDSFTLPSPDPAPSDEYPRGLAFSADGNIAYVGLFGLKYDRLYKFVKNSVGVKELEELPVAYTLSQNYPNPFNPTTNIKFSIPETGFVSLKIYNTLGQEVATLLNEVKSSGTYEVDFNAAHLASGVYVYTLNSANVNISKKMILMK